MIENHMVLNFDDYNVNKPVEIYCASCHMDISDTEHFIVDDKAYCEDCFDYEFGFDDDVFCSSCGEEKATHIVPGGDCLCEDCAKWRYKA